MAAEKRGFGLVGDYGSDLSSSSDEEGEAVKKKAKNQEQSSQDVDPVEERQRREQERLKEREADKWAGVRKEYDDSSLMYKYVTEDENRPEAATNVASGVALSDEARQTIYKEAYEASLYHRNEKKNAEQQALDWEIAQIQNDIEDQRKRWEAVYSRNSSGGQRHEEEGSGSSRGGRRGDKETGDYTSRAGSCRRPYSAWGEVEETPDD